MVRKSKQKIIERSKFKNFEIVSKSFYDAAILAHDFEYFNAAGVLIVHAAIAKADALTIKNGGVKSRGENHLEIINLIKEIMEDKRNRNPVLNHLESIISIKSTISYSGDVYHKPDIDKLFKHYERFSNWANILLNS